MNAIYNEIDPFAASWLEQLIERGHIAPGAVDRRSIAELTAADVAGPGQRHFFAGIGVWSYALRLAGVPDDASIWTGSCPCQPFSSAGKRRGTDDERHLWPTWFALIQQCRPAIVFGEQVASPDGLAWLDAVYADLEGAGYTVGASDLCAASVGAPHIRQRLFFVAFADGERLEGLRVHLRERRPLAAVPEAAGSGSVSNVANTVSAGRPEGRPSAGCGPTAGRCGACVMECAGGSPLANPELHDRPGRIAEPHGREAVEPDRHGPARGLAHSNIADTEHGQESRGGRQLQPPSDALAGFWANAEWIECTDGVSRPVEPGTFPLAHGAAARVGRLRGYGNAIVSQVAATFIEAALGAGVR